MPITNNDMKISKIRIDGFKNLIDTTIKFTGLNALIAVNNYGKSNLLKAIGFGNDFIQATDKEKSALMSFQNSVPINKKTANRNFLFEVELEGNFYNKQTTVNYSYSFEWVKEKKKGARIISEVLKIKTEDDTKPSTFINRNLKKQFYKSSKTGRCDKPIKITNNTLVLNKLSNYDELYYYEIINALNQLELDFFTLDNVEKYFVPQSFAYVNESGSYDITESPSIGKFFYNLQNEEKDKYNLLIDLILGLLPDIEYIKPVQVNFKSESANDDKIPFKIPEVIYDIRVKIKTNNQETSITNLSEGSKRIFHILTVALIADYKNAQLISYEELENSIHPALLQRLLMIISELTNNTQILISSHSPYLIKYLSLDSISIGIPNKDGAAYFKNIKKSKQSKLLNYAKDSESNLGDFIFDMLVEGFDNDSFWLEFI